MKIKTIILIFALFIAQLFYSSESLATGASLYLSPASGSYKIGQSFTVNVFVSSAEQAMNAAQGTILFPTDKLSVVSISKSGSVVNLWTQEPSFSNSARTVSFEGIVLNPGFTGSAGKMISINFTTKAAGDAVVSFSSGSILANDGKGTNIFSGFSNARFNIESVVSTPTPPVSTTPSSSAKTPPAPIVYSSTHPNPNEWYNNESPKFLWAITNDITGVSFLINDQPLSNPGSISDGLVSEKQFKNIEDGIGYFHLRLKNVSGWGAISHFRFNVDTKVPTDFIINFSSKEELLKEGLKAKFSANDDLSGINRFEVKIDNYETLLFPDSESKTYDLPILDPGKHNIAVKVFDNAGNFIADFKEIEIKALDPPKIKEYSSELTTNSFLVVKGSTYPNASLEIWTQKNTEMPVSHKINANEYGNFVFIEEHKLETGVYKLWIEAVNELGLKTEKSKEIFISVQESNLSKLKIIVKDLMVVISVLISSLLFLSFFVLFMIKKVKLSKRKLRKEVHEAEDILEKSFSALYEDMAEQLESLEKIGSKRKLTKEEKKIKKKFKDNLKIAENFIRKEIEDIEKEI
ncbi:MAG: cohesin domain-containing protein [Patescibacteria group bacterium]|nr:cohesin domain-containing protein [Patescibacteria group bacterium]